MAIFTPRGLKIRLEKDLAFTYIARLHPKYTAFQILKTVEGIELVPSIFAFITGIFVFIKGYSPIDIALFVGMAKLIGGIIITFGFFIFPFMIRFITLLSYLSGFGLFLIASIITGLVTVGWKGTLFYFIGYYSASLIIFLIENVQMNYLQKKTGYIMTGSERNFFNAYRLHASKAGVTTKLELEEGEIESGKWKIPYSILLIKWPEVVKRFTDN